MASPDLERITAFANRFDRAQATEVIDLPWGFAVLQDRFPFSQYHNRVVVTSAAPAVEVLATTDELLGRAGVTHRYVSVDGEAGLVLAPDLVDAGYEHETIATMIHAGPEPEPPAHEVRAVSLGTMRPAIVRDWRIELPDATEEELGQLADRMALSALGAEVEFLAVFEGGKIAARADLYLDRAAGIAQFESLVTHPDFRGRGYGTSLVREALRRGRLADCDLDFLTADLDDWPADWYARLGYVEAGRTHHFHQAAAISAG